MTKILLFILLLMPGAIHAEIHTSAQLKTVGSVTFKGEINQINLTGAKWRLIHDGSKVLALIEGKSDTVTTCNDTFTAVEFDTEEKAIEFIEANKLVYVVEDPQIEVVE